MIKKIKSVIKSTVSTIKKVATKKKKLECVVDNQEVNCETFKDTNWVGYPAPASIPYDPWFGSAPKSQKAIQYEEKVAAESKIKEEQTKEKTQEPENIHQVMYEVATKNWNTVKETQGGSENFQEGPGGWNSGTGMGQYR